MLRRKRNVGTPWYASCAHAQTCGQRGVQGDCCLQGELLRNGCRKVAQLVHGHEGNADQEHNRGVVHLWKGRVYVSRTASACPCISRGLTMSAT